MPDLSPAAIALTTLTFVLAGFVKGVTGMGLPTVSMGVLGVFMPPVTAASLLLIPSFVTNVWQLFDGPSVWALLRRLWPMMLAIFVGTLFGARLLTGAGSAWTTVGLGLALVLYALIGLFGRTRPVPPRAEPWLSPVIGLVTGLVTGATGVFVIPAVPYIQGLGFERDELIQALGLSFTVSTVSLAAGLAAGGAFHLGNVAASALAIVPALIGMRLGTIVRGLMAGPTFRRVFLIFLALLGLELIARPLL